MGELITKLAELGYELFSVIIPGIILSLFFLAWWYALGTMAPLWTSDILPELTIETFRTLVGSISSEGGIGLAIPIITMIYLIGHVLHWIARSGPENQEAASKFISRTFYFLIFRVPKPTQSYHPNLEKLFDIVRSKFSPTGDKLDWRQFYPVAKSYLSQHLDSSMVANYQNKYTLHRAVAMAGVVLFWLSLAALIMAAATDSAEVPLVSFSFLSGLLFSALVLVSAFGSSYVYHWSMFGNTIVTETYSYLNDPKP